MMEYFRVFLQTAVVRFKVKPTAGYPVTVPALQFLFGVMELGQVVVIRGKNVLRPV